LSRRAGHPPTGEYHNEERRVFQRRSPPSTSFFLLSGTYDPAKKTWTDTGRWNDPMGGMTPVRAVTKIMGPDEYVTEMSMGLPDGKEFKKIRSIILSRRASS
jgi:hypothetical protein